MSKRAIFEEVGISAQEEADGVPRPAPSTSGEARKTISVWLWLLALLVAAMVLVGGLTRLTDSGLSITVWDPVMGALPPLSAQAWQATFEAYKGTTEFQ